MNTPTPRVSVLMPCRNANRAFFKAAVNSVLCQTTRLWKLIVIADDGDIDEARETLKTMHYSNEINISFVKNDSHFITSKLNSGMRHADTPYVCSLHCDDLLDREAVEVINRYIQEHPHVDFFHTSRLYIDERGYPLSTVYKACDSFNLADFKNYGPVKHLHCWKVESALAIGGMDESLGPHGADDYDFPWSMAEAGCSFKAVAECLYYKRDHREHYRLTTHIPMETQLEELRKIWRKHSMTEKEIEYQTNVRRDGYLRQALYVDEEDKKRKDREGYDIRQGWRLNYR